MIDPPSEYLCVALTLSCLMYSAISFFAWRIYLRRSYTLFWHLAFVAATARWGVELVPAELLTPTMLAFLVELFALAVIAFAALGHTLRVENVVALRYLVAVAVVGTAVLAWSTFVSPHDGLRLAAVPGVASVTALLLAFVVVYRKQGVGTADRILTASLAAFGLVQIFAINTALQLGRVADAAALQAHRHIDLLTLPIAYIGIGTLVLFVFASDLSKKLRGMAVLDQLTGLLNRHGFEGLGQRAFAKAVSADKPLSVIIADLDRFKRINDRFGHAVGDQALVHFAHRLNTGRRRDDVVARIGGEEFLIVLPGVRLDSALQIAETIRVETMDTPVVCGQLPLTITASFGVAEVVDDDLEIADTVARADHALYNAKRDGRNSVRRASASAPSFSETTLQKLSGY